MIPEEPSPPCVIELAPAGPALRGRGRGLDDENRVFGASDLDILPDGRLVVAGQFSDEFFVVSPDGSGGRRVGRGGEGPGEYAFVRWVRVHGDLLHVFDPLLMRRTVLDAADQGVLGAHALQPIGFEGDVAVLDDSTYVINGAIRTPERAGYALHMFNGEGEVVRSFDEALIGLPGTESERRAWRVLAPAREERGVWSAVRSAYRIDLWDAGGTKRRSIVREAPWFPPHSGAVELNPARPALPALPAINGLAEDSEGRLWVVINVASDRWPDCFERTPPDAHPMAGEYQIRAGCRLWDYKIEVLDSETGSILATKFITRGPRGRTLILAQTACGRQSGRRLERRFRALGLARVAADLADGKQDRRPAMLVMALAWTLGMVAGALAPGRAEARQNPCVYCTQMWFAPGVPGHIAQDGDPRFAAHARGARPHPGVVWPGRCAEKHPFGCTGGGGAGGGPLYIRAWGALAAISPAISADDAVEAYRIVAQQPEGSPLYFVADRNAIQLRSCDGRSVVVHIPLAHLAGSECLAVADAGVVESAPR